MWRSELNFGHCLLSFNQIGETKMNSPSLCILGCGNIGSAIARGLKISNKYITKNITLTRRKIKSLEIFKNQGFKISDDNSKAVNKSDIIINTKLI